MTDVDRRSLVNTVGKPGSAAQAILLCMMVFSIIAATGKLYMAGLWAAMAGYSIPRFVALYLSGVSAERTYPGSLIKAGDDVGMALLLMGLTLVLAALWWRGRKERERAQRIINSLKRTGSW